MRKISAILSMIISLNGCNLDTSQDSITSSPVSGESAYELVMYSSETIPVGFEVPITAELISKETGSRQDVSDDAVFTSSDPSIVKIAANNKARAEDSGQVNLETKVEYLGTTYSSVLPLSATDTVVDTLVINSAKESLGIGEIQQYTAIASFADGSTLDITKQPNSTWETSDSDIASINSSTGEVTAISPGVVTISISGIANGIAYSGEAELTVTTAVVVDIDITPSSSYIKGGLEQQYTATALYSDKTTADISTEVNWSVDATEIATIDANGLLTADDTNTGKVTITGVYSIDDKSFSKTAYSIVDNNEASALVSFALSPITQSLPILTEYKFKAVATYDDGYSYDVSNAVTWSVDDSSLATIDNKGLLRLKELTGDLEVSGVYLGETATSTVTITESLPDSVVISPRNITLPKGLTEQLNAILIFESGDSFDVTSYSSLTWASDNPTTASVNNTGLVTAESLGEANISVTGTYNGESFSDSVLLEVTPAIIKSLTVTPRDDVLTETQSKQFIAQITLSDSDTIDVSDSTRISWSSADSKIAQVSESGVVMANTPGTTDITAEYEGLTDNVKVNVVSLSLLDIAEINIESDQVNNIPVGNNANFHLAVTSSTGSESYIQSGTSFSWISSDPSIASIDSTTGVLTTYRSGGPIDISITGDVAGVTPTSNYSLTVSSAEVVSLHIVEGDVQTRIGVPITLTAQAKYTDTSTATLSSVKWASTNPSIGTIDNLGEFTPITAGYTRVKVIDLASGSEDEVLVEVKPATIRSLEVAFESGESAIMSGTQEQLSVIGTWEDNSTKEITRYTDLSTSDKSIATIDSKGVLSAHNVGPFTITASIDGSFSDTINVQSLSAVTSLSIQFTVPTKPDIGDTFQLLVIDQDGTNVTTAVTYSSSDESAFTVNSTGLVTTVGIGQADITASIGSVQDTISFNLPSAISMCGGIVNDTSILSNDGTCLKAISTTAGLFASAPTMGVVNAISFNDIYTDIIVIADSSNTNSSRLAPMDVAMPVMSQPQGVAWCNELNVQKFGSRTNWASPTQTQLDTFYNEIGSAQEIYNTYNYPWVVTAYGPWGSYIYNDENNLYNMAFGIMVDVGNNFMDPVGIYGEDRAGLANMTGQLCISAP